MDPNSKDFTSGGGTSSAAGDGDEFTFARKRSRRVSFAETTAVHVFPRDEDFETPPDSSKPSANEGTKEELGFRGDRSLSDSEDDCRNLERSNEEDDEEEDEEQERFIRDMDSSSPGSVAGSMTSNDEDNFFGIVSTSFIKSGRLSEAGMSDDNNHDITLDSTAFSLHFQNVVLPDERSANSAGSLRTPIEDSLPTDSDVFLVYKGFKKQVPRSKFSDGKMSGSAGNSSNMSLIVENPDTYDYGKLSPTLETLLAKANKSVQANSPMSGSGTGSSLHDDHGLAVVNNIGKDEKHKGEKHNCYTNASHNVGEDFYIDSQLPESSAMGIDSDQNENDISSNLLAAVPIDASTTEKTQATISPKVNSYDKDVLEVPCSNILASNVQNTEMLSPPYGRSPKSLTLQSGQIHHELFGDQINGSKQCSDSSPQSMSTCPALVNLESQYGMQTPNDSLQSLLTPLQGSVSSLRGKRQQLFIDPAVLSQNRLMHTPNTEEPLSFVKLKLIQDGERMSAIKIPNPTSSKLPISTDSRSVSSPQLPFPHELEGTLDEIDNGHNEKYMKVSSTNENHNLTDTAQAVGGHDMSLQLNHSENNFSSTVVENKEVGGAVKLTIGISSNRLSQLRINGKENLSTFVNVIERTPVLDVHGSPVEQTTLTKSSQRPSTLHNGISSPIRMLGDKPASEEGYVSQRVYQTTSLTSSQEKIILPSSISFVVPNSDEASNSQSLKELKGNDSTIYNSQVQVEGSKNMNLECRDPNTAMVDNLAHMKDKLSAKDIISSNVSVPDADRLRFAVNNTTKFLAEGTKQSPKNKDSENKMLHLFSPKEPLKPTQDPNLHVNELIHQTLLSVQESHFVQTEISGKKRGIEQIHLTGEDHVGEMGRIKSPKILTNFINKNFSGVDLQQGDEPPSIGGQAPQKHRKDILSNVSEATKQIFSPSVCVLSPQELDILEDTLAELQKARKYERLYFSLTNQNSLGDIQQKRVAVARSLLDKLAYEKAMLQLKQMKLDKLSNKAQLCKSKIQECTKLKPFCSQICARAQHQDNHLHSDSDNYCTRDQAAKNRVTSMRAELEKLDQRLMPLLKFFESSCKIKGNMSCEGIMDVVNDHIQMKSRCRLIQHDLQLWKISDLVKKNDKCDIVLNYCNVLFQRFTIHSGSISSIAVNFFLENVNIEKKFPKMSACSAFEFVFNVKGNHRVASSKQLSQETLETSLLLGNLLDVLEEILASRTESWNLISSNFHLQASGQLDLQLSFLNFKSGRRVTLSLDLTTLNCAAYPSKASDILIKISEAQSTLPPSVLNNIMGATESLESGRLMIVRLCRSISKVVQDSEGT